VPKLALAVFDPDQAGRGQQLGGLAEPGGSQWVTDGGEDGEGVSHWPCELAHLCGDSHLETDRRLPRCGELLDEQRIAAGLLDNPFESLPCEAGICFSSKSCRCVVRKGPQGQDVDRNLGKFRQHMWRRGVTQPDGNQYAQASGKERYEATGDLVGPVIIIQQEDAGTDDFCHLPSNPPAIALGNLSADRT